MKMKRNDWILILATGLYSYLFYHQTAGINFLIFSIALVLMLIARDSNVWKNRPWLLAAGGSVLSGACVFWYGNFLSYFSNIVSLSILSSLSAAPKSSVIFSLLLSFCSYTRSFFLMFLDAMARKAQTAMPENSRPFYVKIFLGLIPLSIGLIFFFLYRGSNPLFYNFTEKLNLDFISWMWIGFTLVGFLLLYGFFYNRRLGGISDFDENKPNNLSPGSSRLFMGISLENENLSGIILFITLNGLLLVLNLLDLNYLWLDGSLPNGMTYSEFVHQGTGLLILSIIIAVVIVLFYFRGEINFYKDNKKLKVLTYLWILQNIFMLFSTAYRNQLYIHEYTLTYKRIGVYVYLLLSGIGLTTTFLKIYGKKSNWFLFRINGWLFYFVLVLSCLWNWDRMITEYNINEATAKNKKLDKYYLLSLSDSNIPNLLSLNDTGENKSSPIGGEQDFEYSIYYGLKFRPLLHDKLYRFLDGIQKMEWQSLCLEKKRIYHEVLMMNSGIKEIDLTNCKIETLKPLWVLLNLNKLNLSRCHLRYLNELSRFTTIRTLDISWNNLYVLSGFPQLDKLETINLAGNHIYDYAPLYKLKNLKELTTGDITAEQLEKLKINLPTTEITVTDDFGNTSK